MLRRQVSGGFVCLRCRLQGASTANRPGAPLFHSVASRYSGPLSSNYPLRLAQDKSKQLYSTASAAARHEQVRDELDDPIGDQLLGLDTKSHTSSRIHHLQSDVGNSLKETGDELHIDDRLWLESEAQRLASAETLPQHNSGEARPFDPNSNVPRFNSTLLSSLRVYQSRGQRVAAKKEDLIVDILGSPGSALVMRGAGQWKKKGQLKRMEATSGDTKAESLIRHLEREVNDPEIGEILRNIHELQPADKQISPDQFVAARNVLAKGFTARQLATYVADYREAGRNDAHPSRLPTDPPWVVERLPWIAAVDKPDPNLAPILYSYISKSMSRKQKLAVQIMRECWGISSYDVLDKDGLLMVKLRKDELSLLLLGQRRWLSSLANKSLNPGAQITVYPPINTIAILAPHKTGEQILSEINKILERAKTTSFDAGLISASALDPAVLEEVGRITNTVVRLSPSGGQMLVTWIHLASRPDELENLGHVVLRYLLYAADTGPRSSTALTVIPSANAHGGRYVVEQDCGQKMTWMDRLRKWTRWVKPVHDTPSVLGAMDPFEIPATLLAHPLEVQSKREMGDKASASEQALGPAGWSSAIKTDTRAVFGHILHAQPGAKSPLISPLTDFDNSRRHTFLPVNPPLQSLKFTSNLLETGLYHAILVMRFVPAPTQKSAPPALAATAPPLELRIEIDHREIKRIVSVRLVTGTHTGDVMLPSCPVDVRLVQTSYVEVEGRSVDKHAPPVLDFLKQSDIRPWDGKLENPSSLDGIQVPSSLFLRRDNLAPTAGEDSNAVDSTNTTEETVQIDYLFASREIQRVITGEHDGYRVSYWTMDAGQRGGQSDQLVLDAIPMESQEQGEKLATNPHSDHLPEDFLKAVSKIASGAEGFLWQRESPDRYLQNL